MDNRIIILPFGDIWTLVGIGAFIVFLVLLYFLAYRYTKKREVKSTRWRILLNFLLRHDLVTKEVEDVRKFYQSLNAQTQEEIITSTRRFHRLLDDYLSGKSELGVEEKVNILEKLFPSSDRFEEVKEPMDLMTGESCAVVAQEDKFMGSVVKKSADELMISIDEFVPLMLKKESPVGVYVYRPHIGGFLISGTIRELGPDFIIFKFNGNVEQKSGHHLMADMETQAVFLPWPMPEPGEKSASHEIKAVTSIFSDRAIVFTAINEEDIHYYLNRHEIWSLNTKLPGGYVFTCRGIISPSKLFEKKFIFKFLDASETARNVLFIDIKEHNPVTERIA